MCDVFQVIPLLQCPAISQSKVEGQRNTQCPICGNANAQDLTLTFIFYMAQTPTVRPRAHCMVIISCYSEQYVRLKRNVFSPRRTATVDFVLFSSVGTRQLVPRSRCSSGKCSIRHFKFLGSSVARHSLRDWRPAVRTGMKWQRLAGVSL